MKNTLLVTRCWDRIVKVIVILAATGMLIGCAATGDRGTLQRDRDLERRILAFEVFPDHNYYFSGSFGRPNAILGIHKDYQLVSSLWQGVEVSSGQMQRWISAIAPDAMRGTAGYFAAHILDPEGNPVGFWYSIQNTTTIRFLGDNKIEVFTPELQQPSSGRRRHF